MWAQSGCKSWREDPHFERSSVGLLPTTNLLLIPTELVVDDFPAWRNSRRAGLRDRCQQWRAGANPAAGTSDLIPDRCRSCTADFGPAWRGAIPRSGASFGRVPVLVTGASDRMYRSRCAVWCQLTLRWFDSIRAHQFFRLSSNSRTSR